MAVDEIFKCCWPPAQQVAGNYKTQVQKRILEIRRALDPGWSGDSGAESRVLPTQRGRVTAYRLVHDRASADVFRFIDLVAEARLGTPEDRVRLLERALELWAGPPLLDVADKAWAAPLLRQLGSLRLTAGKSSRTPTGWPDGRTMPSARPSGSPRGHPTTPASRPG